jgi:hypothetical protein
MSDRFKLASIRARDWPDADWRCLWLRINLLLRDMAHLFRDRSARPILTTELNKGPPRDWADYGVRLIALIDPARVAPPK